MSTTQPGRRVLEVEDLRVEFPTRKGTLVAVSPAVGPRLTGGTVSVRF